MSPWTYASLLRDAQPWLVALVALGGVLVLVARRRVVTARVAGPHPYREPVTISTSAPARSTLALASAAWVLAIVTGFLVLPSARGAFLAVNVVQVWALLGLVRGLLSDEESVAARAAVSALVSTALLVGTVAAALDAAARLDAPLVLRGSVLVPLLVLAHAIACAGQRRARR